MYVHVYMYTLCVYVHAIVMCVPRLHIVIDLVMCALYIFCLAFFMHVFHSCMHLVHVHEDNMKIAGSMYYFDLMHDWDSSTQVYCY